MRKLHVEEMEKFEGGIVCAVVGATLGILFTPVVGVASGILCHMTYGAYDAY
ncbi:hypothetical protein [Marinifilum sp. D737]|uniref:hypothetical protein n=1 Tax=Marinifilum sp. D737 TaxID=2969628 RepID=UPI0022734D30|nr:hypothetical protein [Marinifilum sp. D737]MCY1635959.1 hypothetical protein [Marinifilum sp. D737]